MKPEATLAHLGLTTKEAKIYLAVLELGTASTSEISGKTKIVRTTVAAIIEKLVARQVIVRTKQGRRPRYFAEPPRQLVHRFRAYERELEAQLPALEAIENRHPTKPKIVFYEGKRGLEQIYADTIETKPTEILELNTSDMFRTFPNFPRAYVAARQKQKIRAKRIAPNDAHWQAHAHRDADELSETLLLPPDEFSIPVELNIYANKLAIMSYADELGIIIESKAIADALRRVYELLWNQLNTKH